MENSIKVVGARQHNLKNVNMTIPKNKLVVFTGVSGSGKSSMAFDTIYAEGQRRYVESLSSYARQFLGLMEKPDIDLIEGLSPSISIDQKTTSKNPRSTVGTVTEIYDYLRLLYARVGHPHCPICGSEIKKQSLDEIVQSVVATIKEMSPGSKIIRIMLLSPVVVDKKGEFSGLFSNLKSKGYMNVRIDGVSKDLSEDFVLLKTNKHNIEVIVDKLSIEKKLLKNEIYLENIFSRLSDSIGASLKLSDGLITVSEILDKTFDIPHLPKEFSDHIFSEKFACPKDNIQIPEIEPRSFSFNSPQGACPGCTGLGKILKVIPKLLISSELSIMEGGIFPFSNMFENDTWYSRLFLTVCTQNKIDVHIPMGKLSKEMIDIILYGSGDREYQVPGKNRFGHDTFIIEKFSGIVFELERRHKDSQSDWVRFEIEKYMNEIVCPVCEGERLKKESLSVTLASLSISKMTNLSVTQMSRLTKEMKIGKPFLTEKESEIARLILDEIDKRLDFLLSVGLNYLTLSRSSGTLSGGESQRIRLASQIGSGLTGVLYVLDEPTIGLHQKDNQKLIDTLKKLRDLGNTVIVVEHDETMMKASDYIFDFGPGAGKNGGNIISEGNVQMLMNDENSVTGEYLSGAKKIIVHKTGKSPLISDIYKSKEKHIKITGCKLYNLKNITVNFPLNKFVAVTGVSGSGKSTLLVESLYPALLNVTRRQEKNLAHIHDDIDGYDEIDKVILIDQSPIGKTPRSNPATYTKLFDDIRDLFAQTRESRTNGFKKGRFSFNVKGGRCEACEGQGQNKIEMQFMSDIWVKCEVCQGKKYNSQTLEVSYKGKNIYEVLKMTVTDALEFFHGNPHILKKLETLSDVGLGYMELGQSSVTLSGGESQRIKLASELGKKDTGKTVYILDEPTTGLHFADVERLLNVLNILVSRGNSIFVIEHNVDVIRNADWIIDLGPEGGENGGYIIAEGPPAIIKNNPKSETGVYL